MSALATQAGGIYRRLGRSDATLSAEDINTLIAYDAGLIMAGAMGSPFPLDWNTAFMMAKSRVIPALKANRPYQANTPNYRQVLDNWERWWEQNIERGTAPASPNNNPQTPTGTIGGQNRPPAPQNRSPQMPTGQIGGQNRPPAPQSPTTQPQGGSPRYSSQARKKRE